MRLPVLSIAAWILFNTPAQAFACPSGTVQINDLCIDQYEATVNGEGYAVSSPDTEPTTNISQIDAETACLAVGRRLCTDTEWLRACRGPDDFTYPYGNTFIPDACNDSGALSNTGSFPACASSEGALDMMGNVQEWTSAPTGTSRGGSYVDVTINGPGCLNTITAFTVYHESPTIGFRCCCDNGSCGEPPLPNDPPLANAGEDHFVAPGEPAPLSGTATDPDGDEITMWQWVIEQANPDANFSLADPTSQNTTFETDTIGVYIITLSVFDGQEWSTPDPVTIIAVESPAPTTLLIPSWSLFLLCGILAWIWRYNKTTQSTPDQ